MIPKVSPTPSTVISLNPSDCFRDLGLEDLKNMMIFYRESLKHCPQGHPNRSMCLRNLAAAASYRFQQLGQTGDLDDAIRYHQEALGLPPLSPSRPYHPNSLNDLTHALSTGIEQVPLCITFPAPEHWQMGRIALTAISDLYFAWLRGCVGVWARSNLVDYVMSYP